MKVKVVLDADVVIHFIKGECLGLLPEILPLYAFVLLGIVYEKELIGKHRIQIDNSIHHLMNIEIIDWNPIEEEKREFSKLITQFGLGESASMVYCKYHNDILASSNLRDIINYCQYNNITYFTTMDFLYQAMIKKIISEKDCNEFITKVLSRGSKLPVKQMSDFRPRLIL